MWDVTAVGRTNVIKQSCQFQYQKISSELSDDIDFFGDTIAGRDGRVQAHKRSLGSWSPFIQLVLPEKLLRIMKDHINVTFEDGRVRASIRNYCLDPMYMVIKVCHCIEEF